MHSNGEGILPSRIFPGGILHLLGLLGLFGLLGALIQPLAAEAPVGTGSVTSGIERHRVVVTVANPEELTRLAGLGLDIAGVNRKEGTAEVIASPSDLGLIASAGFGFRVVETRPAVAPTPLALSDYTDPSEMDAIMDQIQQAYPSLAKKVILEDSLYEGHRIVAMKITKDVDQPNDRPVFVLDAQHHAREVMTAEIARDAMDYLTSRYAGDPEVRAWVDNIVIWIVPVANPDGAAYMFQSDSWWRKNRHPGCPVDLNRNYDFLWKACGGSSGFCSDETYRGAAGDSEPETQALVQLFEGTRATFGLSYHSYGEYLLYPLGCSDPNEKAAMDAVADGLNAVLENDYGQVGQFTQGPVWSAIYKVDGGSLDTQYGRFGTYPYCIEVNCCDFQPDYAQWRDITVQRQRTAWQYFLDRTLTGPVVRGKVTDAATGAPLQAEVSAQEVVFTHGERPRQTDARGLYHWLGAPGTALHLAFSSPGYCTATRTVAVGSGPVDLSVTLAAATLNAPSGLAAAPACPGVRLSWQAVEGAASYSLYRSTSGCGGTLSLLAGAVAGTTYDDATAAPGVPYSYVARAAAASGCESPASSCASATATSAPSAPGVPSFSAVTSSSARLAWGAVAQATNYDLFRAEGGCSSTFSKRAQNLTATSWSDSGLSPSTTYAYFLVAKNTCGPGPSGACATVTTAAPPCSVGCEAEVPGEGRVGTAVSFNGTATPSGSCTGAYTWHWNFGDQAYASEQNTAHTFSLPGSYRWSMGVAVGGASCLREGTLVISEACALSCGASASPASGVGPLEVSFIGSATAEHCAGEPSFAWDFGDGQSSSDASPRHLYATPGSYAWSLTVTADDLTCRKDGSVTVAEPCTLACGASASPGSGTAPLEVAFSGSAEAAHCNGSPSFAWDFGDGQVSSDASPRHGYGTAGSYAWSLTVTAEGLACARTGTVTVVAPCTLACQASVSPESGVSPLEVAFEGSATAEHCAGSPSFEWSFGDGEFSSEASPRHLYGSPGLYSWNLTVAAEGLACRQEGSVRVEVRLPGDADGDGVVTIGEVQQAINEFLGEAPANPSVDANGDGAVSIGEVQRVISAFLGALPGALN